MKKLECTQILHEDDTKDDKCEEYVRTNLAQGLTQQIKEHVELKKEVMKSGKIKFTMKIYYKEKLYERDE